MTELPEWVFTEEVRQMLAFGLFVLTFAACALAMRRSDRAWRAKTDAGPDPRPPAPGPPPPDSPEGERSGNGGTVVRMADWKAARGTNTGETRPRTPAEGAGAYGLERGGTAGTA